MQNAALIQVDGAITSRDMAVQRPSLFSRQIDTAVYETVRGAPGAVTHYFPTKQCISIASHV